MTIAETDYGHEEELTRTEKYVLRRHVVEPGRRSRLQYHCCKDSTFHVVHGVAAIELGGDVKLYWPGYEVRVPPRESYRFGSEGGCVLLETGTADDPLDSVRLERGGVIPHGWLPAG